MKYTPTIGLEIHAELKTRTKMFCNSKNDPEERRPNINICPICMGHPGTLPVINKSAVKHVLKVGCALGSKLADFTEFDRKNYFYPDLPKGYQISQYKYPLVLGGSLCGVEITRIHLEEDTARSVHDTGGDSMVDFNRAGIPLMELVTEPVITDAKVASSFAREFQLLLRYLDVSDANMEKGEMRVEANISIRPKDDLNDLPLGTKVEVKNLNSFKSVERAIAYEIERQTKMLKSGENIIQETRGWNEQKQCTFSQRIKEESQDYRYIPDPDLPKLKISEVRDFKKESLLDEILELPWEKRKRYIDILDIKPEDAELFVQNSQYRDILEKFIIPELEDDRDLFKLAVNYLTSDVVGIVQRSGSSTDLLGSNYINLIKMIGNREISSRAAKEILSKLISDGGDPCNIAEKDGLLQENNEEKLIKIVEEILKEQPQIVNDYKKGKESVLQFLVGQGIKKSGGSANPEVLKKLILDNIKK